MTGSSQPTYVNSSSTTSTQPRGEVTAAQNNVLAQAQSQFENNPQQYYPGATYVPQSDQTQQGLAALQARAAGGSPLATAGQQQMLSTINGDYLNGQNPQFQNMVNQARDAARTSLDPSFAASGNNNSSAYVNALTDATSKGAQQLAYQNYSTERGNQMNAAAAAPQYAQNDYFDINQMLQAGQTQEGYASQQLQDAISRFNFGQNQPGQQLSRYAALVNGGNYGSNSNSTQMIPSYSNGLATGVGTAASAASILGTLFGRGGLFAS